MAQKKRPRTRRRERKSIPVGRAYSPEIDEDDFIKRIIGMPGEKVVIANSKVIIHKRMVR